MNTVKFDPSNMAPAEINTQSQANQDGVTANPGKFPAPPVLPFALAAQKTVVANLISGQTNAALAFANVSKDLKTESKKHGNMVMQNAVYVDGICITDMPTAKATANLGGFPTKHDPVHHTSAPGVVAHVSVTQGDLSGSADLHWDPNGSKLYKLFYSLDTVNFNWVLGDSTDVSSGTISGLPVKVPLAFMVLGHNSNGDSDQSASIKVEKTLL